MLWRLGVSLRTRLTLWYGALLATTLLGFSLLLYFTLERSLSSSVNEALHLRAEQIRRVLGADLGRLALQPEDVPPSSVEASPLDEFAAPGIYVQVINARGAVLYAPANLPGGELPIRPDVLAAMRAGRSLVVDLPVGDTTVRVLTVPLASSGAISGGVQVGQSLSPLETTMGAVSRLLFSAGLAALLMAVIVGWLLTGRALSPVAHVTQTARHIAATGDYRQRIALPPRIRVSQADELYFLASTFNAMIARLEQVLDSQRRLLADTSHELRTPLTIIRGNLAVLRRASGVPAETLREAVAEADEEAARMGRLVDDLLLLARADAGQMPSLQRAPVDLVQLAAEVVERVWPVAGTRALRLDLDPSSPPSVVLGDRDRLVQVVANLLENAVRYTSDGGEVRLRIERPPAAELPPNLQRRTLAARSHSSESHVPGAPSHWITLAVSDTGAGIAAEHLPHVFERFYRADRARTRADGGTGLGLSIARTIARAHGGDVIARSAGVGQGSTFEVWLPLASSATGTESVERPRSRGAAAARPASAPALENAS